MTKRPAETDIALKNTELKEEVKRLKEKQSDLLREILQHKYAGYKLQAEVEALLVAHKNTLNLLVAETEQLLNITNPKHRRYLRENVDKKTLAFPPQALQVERVGKTDKTGKNKEGE